MKTTIAIILFLLCISNSIAQNGTGQKAPSKGQKNANKGQYEENNSQKVHPYTIFIKTKEGFNILSDIDYIEREILLDTKQKGLKSYYLSVFKSALSPFNPADTAQIGGHIKYTTWGIKNGVYQEYEKDCRKGVSESSKMCKNAAFVYLIGVDSSGKTLRRSTHPDTISYYNDFKTRAIQRLQYMNVKTVVNPEYMQWRSKEIIHYLQAYDMLKTAEMLADQDVPGYSFTQTEKEQLEVIKYNLQRFARNIYQDADNLAGSLAFYRSNNHTIMSASALGLAAIVLNDCGHNGHKNNWHPKNWARVAHYKICYSMWDQTWYERLVTGGTMSKRDTIAGYAEGPKYFSYCFENAVPFFRAFSNYVPFDFEPRTYRYLVVNSMDVRNYNFDPNYLNLYEWYFRITQPDGYLPTYDDTRFNEKYGIFNVIGGVEPTNDYNFYSPSSYGSGVNLDADYLAYGMPQPNTIQDASHNVAFKASGDLILRTPYNVDKNNAHYIRIAGESSTAINGGNHEHADVSNFIITAGNEILALDPGYFSYDNRDLTNQANHHNVIFSKSILGAPDGPDPNTKPLEMGDILSVPSLSKSYILTHYQATDFTRNIEMYKVDNEHYYYVMNDFVNRYWEDPEKTYIWTLNANGNVDEGSCIQDTIYDSKVFWTHPCKKEVMFRVHGIYKALQQ